MTTEQKKRKPPVFQGFGDDPVVIDPPFQSAPEEIEDAPVENLAPPPAFEPDPPVVADDPYAGWKLITEEQQDGRTYLVTDDFEEEGVTAFWRKTRALSHFRWVYKGKWTDPLTRKEILPEPLFYKVIG